MSTLYLYLSTFWSTCVITEFIVFVYCRKRALYAIFPVAGRIITALLNLLANKNIYATHIAYNTYI